MRQPFKSETDWGSRHAADTHCKWMFGDSFSWSELSGQDQFSQTQYCPPCLRVSLNRLTCDAYAFCFAQCDDPQVRDFFTIPSTQTAGTSGTWIREEMACQDKPVIYTLLKSQ